jgi:hypothetical protein
MRENMRIGAEVRENTKHRAQSKFLYQYHYDSDQRRRNFERQLRMEFFPRRAQHNQHPTSAAFEQRWGR